MGPSAAPLPLEAPILQLMTGPALIIVPGLLALAWAIVQLRRRTASRRWTPVVGRVVEQTGRGRDAADVIEYPLAEGGHYRLTADPHGRYPSGRPAGTPVRVWRNPADGLVAVVEQPGVEALAVPIIVAALGAFFAGSGVFWAVLIVGLATR